MDVNFVGTVDHIFFVGADYQVEATISGGAPIKASVRPGVEHRQNIAGPGSMIQFHVPRQALHVVTRDKVL